MSAMKFRESNQVKWLGVRPGHNGVQVIKSTVQIGSGNSIIVTAGPPEDLYITYFFLNGRLSTDASCAGSLDVWDATPAHWRRLAGLRFDIAGQDSLSAGLFFPIEIPSGYTIRVLSSNDLLDVECGIIGFEQ